MRGRGRLGVFGCPSPRPSHRKDGERGKERRARGPPCPFNACAKCHPRACREDPSLRESGGNGISEVRPRFPSRFWKRGTMSSRDKRENDTEVRERLCLTTQERKA